jgi:hypothetical protein
MKRRCSPAIQPMNRWPCHGHRDNAWFSVTDLLLLGLVCLALHQAGIGSAWIRRR